MTYIDNNYERFCNISRYYKFMYRKVNMDHVDVVHSCIEHVVFKPECYDMTNSYMMNYFGLLIRTCYSGKNGINNKSGRSDITFKAIRSDFDVEYIVDREDVEYTMAVNELESIISKLDQYYKELLRRKSDNESIYKMSVSTGIPYKELLDDYNYAKDHVISEIANSKIDFTPLLKNNIKNGTKTAN